MSDNNSTGKKPSIGYKGIVTVTIKQGKRIVSKKVLHNEGAELLFMSLCRCLISDNDGLSYMPNFLNAGYDNNGSFASVMVSPSFINSKAISSSGGVWAAVFNANITYSQLNSTHSIEVLQLCATGDGSNVLATLTLDESEYITIQDSSYTALVEWKMSFQNVAEG